MEKSLNSLKNEKSINDALCYKGTIVCFTASYPYGNREAYFDVELEYLAKEFEKVIIIPRYNPFDSDEIRNVPSNVEVWAPVVPQGFKRFFLGVLNFSPCGIFMSDFFSKKVYFSRSKIKKWFNSLLVHRIMYSKVKGLLDRLDTQSILYSYWAEAPLFTCKRVKKFKKVVRMHGGDFYLERNFGYLPLRQQIYDNSDLLLPISNDICDILINNYNLLKSKIFVNYLGVTGAEEKKDFTLSKDSKIIVSCSNVIPLKRVHLIVEALMLCPGDVKIEWHHFGDGSELEIVKEKALLLKGNINVSFHGWTKPEAIMKFYKENNVSWFVNVSRYEGIPVSIMEAFSFGIPAIATDVGGTSEIVSNNINGYLLESCFKPSTLLNKILNINSFPYNEMRENAFNTWLKKFNASINYEELLKKMKSIEKKGKI